MRVWLVSLLLVEMFLAAGPAGAEELQFELGGAIQSDLRFRPDDKSVGEFYNRLEWKPGVARNENRLEFRLRARYGDVGAVAELRAAWLGWSEPNLDLGHLSDRNSIDPYYFEARAAYLDVTDFLVEGLDLRLGQQLVLWGVGDQFNPTNNFNANDVEDVLLFGDQRANFMVRADYNFLDDFSISGVLVPVFQGAQLPRSSGLGLALVDRTPFLDQTLGLRVAFENALSAQASSPAVVGGVTVRQPERNFENMPFGFRLAGVVFGQDVAVSYYRGRHDFPQAVLNHAYQESFDDPATPDVTERLCNPAVDPQSPDFDPDRHCVDALIKTDVTLEYPRMQVIGFNLAGEIPLDWIDSDLLGIGYRVEVGVYFPQPVEIQVQQEAMTVAGIPQAAGEYNYHLGGRRPLVVDDTPFAKWVIGLDYSFGPHWMVNLMWVHGMTDEFGAGDFLHQGYVVRQSRVASDDPLGCLFDNLQGFDPQAVIAATETCARQTVEQVLRPRIGDYAVAGVDFQFADQKALLRLFAIWDVSGYYRSYYDEQAGQRRLEYLSLFGDGFSMIVYPEFRYNFGNGFELGAGALLQLGQRYTKFGDPAAGGSLIWTRARFSF